MEQKILFSKGGIEVAKIEEGGKEFLGVKVELEGAPLLIIKGKKLVVGCAYLNPETLEKMGNAACIVSGVKDFEDVFEAEIKISTSNALKIGARPGVKVRDALALD